jgi:hypothetical protein
MYYDHQLLSTKLTPSSTSPATAYVFSFHSPLNIVTSSIPKMSSEIELIQDKSSSLSSSYTTCSFSGLFNKTFCVKTIIVLDGRMTDELEGTEENHENPQSG